jgi:Tfp pilus assembly protein PilF
MNRRDYAHALSYFSTALGLEEVPNKTSILKNMVTAYENQSDFASAKDVLEQYLDLVPDDETALKEMTFLSTR